MQQTILKSSLLPLPEHEPDEAWVRKGLETAESAGFGRALFSVRVAETMEKCGKQRATSFFLGVLLSLDFALLNELMTRNTTRLVLYGKSLYPSLFEPLVKEKYPELEVIAITEEESDRLSARGAMRIFEQYKVQ
jgi:2-keto-3-deoxy-galactonokinase